jgi:hypothetical protein
MRWIQTSSVLNTYKTKLEKEISKRAPPEIHKSEFHPFEG